MRSLFLLRVYYLENFLDAILNDVFVFPAGTKPLPNAAGVLDRGADCARPRPVAAAFLPRDCRIVSAASFRYAASKSNLSRATEAWMAACAACAAASVFMCSDDSIGSTPAVGGRPPLKSTDDEGTPRWWAKAKGSTA